MKRRVAAIGLRSFPSEAGAAGAEKFAEELFPRLVERGYAVTAYTRVYSGQKVKPTTYRGIHVIPLRTTRMTGFDTLVHSFKATLNIILHNTGDIVHIQNGGNSIWALPLRLFRKKVFVSQDGVDWKRDKWPWYGKLYLYLSTYVTATFPNAVVFDNVFARAVCEKKFRKRFDYIPFGSEVAAVDLNTTVLNKLGLEPNEYFLFVGRFIPDKGLHYMLSAFERTKTRKKLVLVGGAPNPSGYERRIRSTKDDRVLFPGFVYGDDVHSLMKYAYAYVQASDIEGLSPVLLEVIGLGTPVICSDIPENLFAVKDAAVTFRRGNVEDLQAKLATALGHPEILKQNADRAKERVLSEFTWKSVVDQHVALFDKICTSKYS